MEGVGRRPLGSLRVCRTRARVDYSVLGYRDVPGYSWVRDGVARKSVSVDEIMKPARALKPADRARLIERVTVELARDIGRERVPRRSLFGLWSDLGVAPSAQDIETTRLETWLRFPRDQA